ncbi:MAG: hypothetical protein KatS3mg108_2021 [Isosphaeraceae bacterium]|jgi:hypothetical protein|nr:MAG: hypothetical protein KatS3mg108_2021 [Isosphaeraceae bacterium]
MIGALRVMVALGLILGAGWAYGNWTHRWGVSPAVERLAAQVAALPAELVAWRSTGSALDPRELRAAGGAIAIHRTYETPGASPAAVFLIAGRSAPVSSHSPEVCYPGAGFRLGPIERIALESSEPGTEPWEFATAVATREEPGRTQAIRLFWAWNDGQGWRAPSDPRVAYVAAPALCKLYLISPEADASLSGEEGPVALLRAVATQYADHLFPSGVGRQPDHEPSPAHRKG